MPNGSLGILNPLVMPFCLTPLPLAPREGTIIPCSYSISYVFCDSTPSFNGTCLEWYLARSGTWHDQVPGTIRYLARSGAGLVPGDQILDRARYQICQVVPGTRSCQVPDRARYQIGCRTKITYGTVRLTIGSP
jgi:hypothetical protein